MIASLVDRRVAVERPDCGPRKTLVGVRNATTYRSYKKHDTARATKAPSPLGSDSICKSGALYQRSKHCLGVGDDDMRTNPFAFSANILIMQTCNHGR